MELSDVMIIDDQNLVRPRDKKKSTFDLMPWIRDKNGQPYSPYNLTGSNFWNYYITYISLIIHIGVMTAGLNFWCNYSKFVMFYSFQVLLLHAYSWAIPDRRFAYWVKDKRKFFYIVSGANIFFYFLGIIIGSMMYTTSDSGMIKFMGVSIMLFTILDKTIMVIMFSINYINLAHRFDYESIPYNYDPTTNSRIVRQSNSTSAVQDNSIQIIHI